MPAGGCSEARVTFAPGSLWLPQAQKRTVRGTTAVPARRSNGIQARGGLLATDEKRFSAGPAAGHVNRTEQRVQLIRRISIREAIRRSEGKGHPFPSGLYVVRVWRSGVNQCR